MKKKNTSTTDDLKLVEDKKRKSKFYILITAFILLISAIYAFFNGSKINADYNKLPQELDFYVMEESDIKDKKLKEWIEKNKYEKGIHTINHTDIGTFSRHTYILLSTGIEDMDINIKLFSIEGTKDKLILNGRVEALTIPDSIDITIGFKPYMIIRIERDNREVVLGDFNLNNVESSQNNIDRINVDMGLFHSLEDEKVTLTLLDTKENIHEFKLSEDMKNELGRNPINNNSLVAVNYKIEKGSDLPIITHIRETNKVITRLVIEQHILEEGELKVKSNDKVLSLGYKEEMLNTIKSLKPGMKIIGTIEKQDNILVLSEIFGANGAIN